MKLEGTVRLLKDLVMRRRLATVDMVLEVLEVEVVIQNAIIVKRKAIWLMNVQKLRQNVTHPASTVNKKAI